MVDTLIDDIGALVEVESPSGDAAALTRSAAVLAALIERRLGSPAELIDGPNGPHVRWRGCGTPGVLILGHHDTVFPIGSLAANPFRVDGDVLRGPGVFDMKAGIVIAIHAVAALADRSAIEMLWTSDEETGSWTSRQLIDERARACGTALVFEPSADGGAVKTARKGTGTFEVIVRGRAAHAGLEPEKGINSLVAAAALIGRITTFGDPRLGTTVTPTMCAAGTADNVVPAETRLMVDARVSQPGEKERVESLMAALSAMPATVEVRGGITRPPMPASASAPLLPALYAAADTLGLTIGTAEVGGGSDGNLTAAAGVPTLDGLGAVGGNAHADTEHVLAGTLIERVALIHALLERVTSGTRHQL